jgi:rhamnulokinase
MESKAACQNLLAVDLGAESGRLIAGSFDGNTLGIEVLHRFPNRPVRLLDRLHWDLLDLHREILNGLRLAGQKLGQITSVGVDTWGVDFAFLGKDGGLLGNPRHYRDPHTESIMESVFQIVPKRELYSRTGIQFMRFNSLFQLAALKRDKSPLLDAADRMLFMPDLFHYLLCGEAVNEYTDASTSQMIRPDTRSFDNELLGKLGLPTGITGAVTLPGTVIGKLAEVVRKETGVGECSVTVPATHDTAAAVAAVPVDRNRCASGNWAYLSSGTWSLLGMELAAPRTDEAAFAANVTNEGGVNGTIRLLKNIMGLWLIQECRRAWEREGRELGYEELVRLAAEAEPFYSLVDPDCVDFLLPAHMPKAFAGFCSRTGQHIPEGPGPVVRCAMESLALKYRMVLGTLEKVSGHKAEVLHVVGGGCQNRLLCQFTADACGIPVVAGPVEATAIGNLLTQAMGVGSVKTLADAREVVRRSFEVHTYEPRNTAHWDAQWERFQSLVGR